MNGKTNSMRRYLYAICSTLLISAIGLSQNLELNGTEKIQLVTSIENLAHVESVAYSDSTQLLYVSVQADQQPGDGSIVTLNLEGIVQDRSYVTGLNNPKGIAIFNNKLYVSDQKELVEIQLATGEILNKYHAGDELFLNDVAIDDQGQVYVSDMRSSSIYKLDTQSNYTKWLSTPLLENPNGLLVQNDTLYVAAWGLPEKNKKSRASGRFLKVSLLDQSITAITPTAQGNLDGLQTYDQNHFLISDWSAGILYKVSKNGDVVVFLKSQPSVGDHLYLQDKKLLILPLNRQNTVQFFKL